LVESKWTATFVQRLAELGWVEGRTIVIEYRWADGDNERSADIVADLIRRKVDIIVGHGAAVPAAKRATSTIPIVFTLSGDPVAIGLVASLARPGGNVTGLSIQQTDVAGKRLEILREALPGAHRLRLIGNAGFSQTRREIGAVEGAAAGLGLEIGVLEVHAAEDISPAAFDALKGQVDALYVISDPLVNSNRERINELALAARLPTIHTIREQVEAGGLMSYGASPSDNFRRAAEFVDKILRGAKPADIPVEQPTKFELVVNLKTAKALGLKIPEAFLLRADEVIE
jgi:putative ABC transport system substrate-binding protein